MSEHQKIQVDVVYASPTRQKLCSMLLHEGAMVVEAIRDSGILEEFPEIDLQVNAVGIFGRLCELHTRLKPGDRVEIYRNLLLDPKDQRRLRASNQQSNSAGRALRREK